MELRNREAVREYPSSFLGQGLSPAASCPGSQGGAFASGAAEHSGQPAPPACSASSASLNVEARLQALHQRGGCILLPWGPFSLSLLPTPLFTLAVTLSFYVFTWWSFIYLPPVGCEHRHFSHCYIPSSENTQHTMVLDNYLSMNEWVREWSGFIMGFHHLFPSARLSEMTSQYPLNTVIPLQASLPPDLPRLSSAPARTSF